MLKSNDAAIHRKLNRDASVFYKLFLINLT